MRRRVVGAGLVSMLSAVLLLPGVASAQAAAGGTAAACGPVGKGYARCFTQVLLNPGAWRGGHVAAGRSKPAPAATIAGYYPSDLQSAYGLAPASSSDGSGVTVAIADAFNNPHLASDLATYRSTFGLPPCTQSSGCLTIVNQSGGTKLPRGNKGWGTEESLDLQMVSAICPNCKILLVEASSATFKNLGIAAAYAAAHAPVVSNSYGGSEFSGETSYNGYYSAAGTTFVASAGDSGYGVEFPAAAPTVVSAGGTTLTKSSSTARGWTETVWSGSGSGCSAYEPNPGWQPVTSLCSSRTVADTSADANPNTGVAIYDSYGQPGWMVVGGTSVASPVIASVFALAGNDFGPSGAQQLYSSTASLYKVASGSNSSGCTDYLCNAADSLSSGYNGPTGNGTPDGISAF